jgi:hypothetical protein
MREANCNCSDNQERAMLTEMLAPEDIQFSQTLSAAIELDQVNVDALPPERFRLRTATACARGGTIIVCLSAVALDRGCDPAVMLKQLTGIATAYEPAFVGSVVQNFSPRS